jgi:hypothetical protein
VYALKYTYLHIAPGFDLHPLVIAKRASKLPYERELLSFVFELHLHIYIHVYKHKYTTNIRMYVYIIYTNMGI